MNSRNDQPCCPDNRAASGATATTVLLLLLTALNVFGAGKPLLEWAFDHPGDLRGWQPNSHLAEVTVTNGVLSCRAVGNDPILELRPLLDLAASPWQLVEIRLKADRDGTAELFWSNTSQGRYGGFEQEKTTRFHVSGDSQWHTYLALPCWHLEGKIVRLRFDVYDGTRFELASIRVLELEVPPSAARAEFDFTSRAQGWQWLGTTEEREFSGAWKPEALQAPAAAMVLSPPIRIDAASNNFVAIRMTVDRGHNGTLFFITDQKNHLLSYTFPIEADGLEHTYNLFLLNTRNWRGHVLALGLRPSEATNPRATIRWLKLADKPQGPPQLRLSSFGLEEVLPRTGRSATLRAVLSNTGGEPATNVRAQLTLPRGVKLQGRSSAKQTIAALPYGKEATLRWTVDADRPIDAGAALTIRTDGAPTVRGTAPVHITRPPALYQSGYVPEPRPVRGPFEVGVYYFPGWNTAKQWQPLQAFPERKPALGCYREGDPEVADWHIKWAVEHSITFFAYDWYWCKGERYLEHALHDGLFKARYHSLLKFCLLWANHNPPGTSTHADCLAVTRYWLDTYFRRPEYLAFDAKPVVIIFSPGRLTEDLGAAGVKQAFEAMRAECKAAGLRGLHLIACIGDTGGARQAAAEGYDAVTAYNWPDLGMVGEGMFAPFETLLDGYRHRWERLLVEGAPRLGPVPVCGGWDSRPWHGADNIVRFGRTPELFRRHLQDARDFLERQPASPGVPKAVLIEAWNEWGEGSYIEPHAEFGFGYLDAVRSVFTDAASPHQDVTPADAGLGPYDVPGMSPRQP